EPEPLAAGATPASVTAPTGSAAVAVPDPAADGATPARVRAPTGRVADWFVVALSRTRVKPQGSRAGASVGVYVCALVAVASLYAELSVEPDVVVPDPRRAIVTHEPSVVSESSV